MIVMARKSGSGNEKDSDLVAAYQRGEPGADAALMRAHAGLLWALAKRYASRSMPAEDLSQHGYLGLLEAGRRFDAAFGVKFSTFAQRFVGGRMLDAVRFRGSGLIYLPRKARQRGIEVRAHLEAGLHDSRDGKPQTLNDLAIAPPLPRLDRSDLEPLFRSLRPNEEYCVRRYFFFDRTMKQIGDELGLSESSVSLKIAAAVAQMQRAARHRPELRELLG